MSSKAIVHLEGNRYGDNQFFMSQKTHGNIGDQLAMIAQYCIQVATNTGEDAYTVIAVILKYVNEQISHESFSLDRKIIEEILGRDTNGQKE